MCCDWGMKSSRLTVSRCDYRVTHNNIPLLCILITLDVYDHDVRVDGM